MFLIALIALIALTAFSQLSVAVNWTVTLYVPLGWKTPMGM
jgi:hypothetical protein